MVPLLNVTTPVCAFNNCLCFYIKLNCSKMRSWHRNSYAQCTQNLLDPCLPMKQAALWFSSGFAQFTMEVSFRKHLTLKLIYLNRLTCLWNFMFPFVFLVALVEKQNFDLMYGTKCLSIWLYITVFFLFNVISKLLHIFSATQFLWFKYILTRWQIKSKSFSRKPYSGLSWHLLQHNPGQLARHKKGFLNFVSHEKDKFSGLKNIPSTQLLSKINWKHLI